MTQARGKPNHLIHSTSPYLLQHAYNPVDWHPWGAEALQKAAGEDKPIILSIGYSSCHWCHVMERESFESEEVADIMNSRFVSIKVDREERPDIDQVYMEAVQAMGVHGGWPLNVFLTPGQKPFYGGTYFRPEAWKKLLVEISDTYKNQRKEIFESAQKFSEYIGGSELGKFNIVPDNNFNPEDFSAPMEKLASQFDKIHGGFRRSPKFPMPGLWKFFLNYSFLTGNEALKQHVFLTLKKMAMGGIYDQVGGGFSRYSTDERWFAPHFEKMLYDNAQLISLYSDAYRLNPDPLFKEVVCQSVEFIQREMTGENNGFYSALDADSEGEEGKYYAWTEAGIDKLLGDDAGIMKSYWSVSGTGNWELNKNILAVQKDQEDFCEAHGINTDKFEWILEKSRRLMFSERNKRVRPGLDDKVIVAWNALMIKALADAFLAFSEKKFLESGLNKAEWLTSFMGKNGKLPRTITAANLSSGYLDDYACLSEAFLSLYHVTFEEKWIQRTKLLVDYVMNNFRDPDENLFYYSDASAENLIARKKEVFDNVIPGSNSVMAMCLFRLGTMLGNESYTSTAVKMISGIQQLLKTEPEYLYNWGNLSLLLARPTAEIAVVGKEFRLFGQELENYFYPGKIVMATENESPLPLFEGRPAADNKTTIYVCYDKSCRLPVYSVQDALNLLE